VRGVHIDYDQSIIDLTDEVAAKELSNVTKVLETEISIRRDLRLLLVRNRRSRCDKE
jgi:hypothetical protein